MTKNFELVCVFFVAVSVIIATTVSAEETNHRMEKRSADDKRDDAFMNDLASALGSMQRPRFGKRFMYYGPEAESIDKKNSFAELESALGSMQRPRFGRSVKFNE